MLTGSGHLSVTVGMLASSWNVIALMAEFVKHTHARTHEDTITQHTHTYTPTLTHKHTHTHTHRHTSDDREKKAGEKTPDRRTQTHSSPPNS